MSKRKNSGFLLAGIVAGDERIGYLHIPYYTIRSVDFYCLSKTIGFEAHFIEESKLSEFVDQPIRFVFSAPDDVVNSGEVATIHSVTFMMPQFISYDVRVIAKTEDGKKISAGGSSVPEGADRDLGVDPDTILEVYHHYDEVDHRPWSIRVLDKLVNGK